MTAMATTARGGATPARPLQRAPLDTLGISKLLAERELRGNGLAVDSACHAHASFMTRLACDAVLDGHRGCVNHLRWNRSGSLLASGSDDHQVIVWDYATHKQREAIQTGHTGNIFAVCFVPETNDHIIASAAADCDVRVHYAPFRADATKLFRVHNGRVKDIGTSWGVPKVFWSVAEDGVVFQFDVRALPTTDGRGETHDASGVIVRLGRDRRGKVLRGMGMATHPLDPTKFVLACGDYYTRLFDHRMLRLEPTTRARSGGASSRATVPVQVFAPPHLHLNTFSDRRAKLRHDEAHGTSIQFSSDGAQVLTNYHNDHIYLFQVAPTRDSNAVTQYERPERPAPPQPTWRAGAHMDEALRPLALHASDVRELHSQGLVALLARNYVRALKAFTTACSARAVVSMAASFRKELFHHCAKAYLGRAWSCDAHLAAVYCKRALALDASDRSVELTYIEALHADKKTAHCRVVAQAYAAKHRAHASDVEQYLESSSQSPQNNQQQQRLNAVLATPPSSASEPSDSDDDDNNDSDRGLESSASADAVDYEDARSSSSSNEDEGDASDSASEKSDSGASHTPTSLSSEPETDDAFWISRDVLGQAVNCDVVHRYIGYCNNETDIKEAAFIGPNDAFIVAGSDDGRAYVWHTASGRLVNAIVADETIVNCVRPHPFDTCLATSGIEDVIRLWSPTGDADLAPSLDDLDAMTSANQRRMANNNWSFYFGGTERDVIRVVFQPTGREGVQECATS